MLRETLAFARKTVRDLIQGDEIVITIKQKGDYATLTKYLKKSELIEKNFALRKYAELGVEALKAATPVDSGLTADSWTWDIHETRTRGIAISFKNSNVNYSHDGKPVNIAIILQYGHGTGTGGWVEGIDYINPALQPVFEQLAQDLWEEVTKV